MPDPELPEVTVGAEDGFADLTLRLEDLHTADDGACYLRARGVHRGELVGFAAVLGSEWTKQPLDNALENIYWGEVTIASLGELSNRFLSVLDDVYGTRLGPKRMRPATRFLGAGLNNDPHQVRTAKTHIKLFFEHDDEEQAAEMYFNVDPLLQVVEFHEKDSDYRAALVRCLSEAPTT